VATARAGLTIRVCGQVRKTLINLALFQLGWLVCVLGGNVYAVGFTLLALLLHQWLILEQASEWKLIGIVVVCGCLWDMAMVQTGVIHYTDAILAGLPLWLVCLWLLFATTFMHSLSWLRRYLWLAVPLAGVFGPASYWFGANLTDAELRAPVIVSLAIMAAGWALLFPCGICYAAKLKEPR
jgi:hypothetical protein